MRSKSVGVVGLVLLGMITIAPSEWALAAMSLRLEQHTGSAKVAPNLIYLSEITYNNTTGTYTGRGTVKAIDTGAERTLTLANHLTLFAAADDLRKGFEGHAGMELLVPPEEAAEMARRGLGFVKGELSDKVYMRVSVRVEGLPVVVPDISIEVLRVVMADPSLGTPQLRYLIHDIAVPPKLIDMDEPISFSPSVAQVKDFEGKMIIELGTATRDHVMASGNDKKAAQTEAGRMRQALRLFDEELSYARLRPISPGAW